MARERWSFALALTLLALLLVPSSDAQGKKGKGKKKGGAPSARLSGKKPPLYLPAKPGGNTRAPAPIGPKPGKAGAKQAAEPKQVDPMRQADQVTAAADHRSEQEEAEERLLREHFRVCDLDNNGWLSLREGEVTLSLDRTEFRRADQNQDGRIDRTEFGAQRELLLARLGALPKEGGKAKARAARPAPEDASEQAPAAQEGGESGAPQAPASEPAQAAPPEPSERPRKRPQTLHSELGAMRVKPRNLLERYDADSSKGIDAVEIQKLLTEIGLELSPELVIAQMDPDDSGQLEANELVAVAWMASQHLPEALRPEPVQKAAPETAQGWEEPLPDDVLGEATALESPDSLDEQGAPESTKPRKTERANDSHFNRLDADGNGFIDEADLRKLQSPARLDLRLRAILSAMDGDGDGRLSEAEFEASLSNPPH